MKRSQLRQIIREEIQRLDEDYNFIKDAPRSIGFKVDYIYQEFYNDYKKEVDLLINDIKELKNKTNKLYKRVLSEKKPSYKDLRKYGM